MKIVLLSMPDSIPMIMHESAFHLPNCGIASIGANLDEGHDVYVVDLIRKRRHLAGYLKRLLLKIHPKLVGLSAMAWQYETCIEIIRFIRLLLPEIKIAIGGYHATLMYEEIAASPESGLIDFMIRGEGEEAFRRLVNALESSDQLQDIPSLSFKRRGTFCHNPRGTLLDLSRLKIPIRDKRRLTSGYHAVFSKIEVIETSRGCTRTCSFCSMREMYGQTFRTFPIERVTADIDDIYYKHNTRAIFIVDDNLVLDPERVIDLCDAIIAKNYKGLSLHVQADCISIAGNETMVRKMSLAGVKTVFLGIENVVKKNLMASGKGDIVDLSRKAVRICHQFGIMVIAGLIFGFPDDDENDIVDNYRFLKSLDADIPYCQILTPYPKTPVRQQLLERGMVTNLHDYKLYNGLRANIKTRHLDTQQLQYLVWLHRQKMFGWWEPSRLMRIKGGLWVTFWTHLLRPFLRSTVGRQQAQKSWKELYERDVKYLDGLNQFKNLARNY